MLGSIEAPSDIVIDADWWSVDHQSTDFLIIGILTTPTTTKIDIKRSAFSKLEKDLLSCTKRRDYSIVNDYFFGGYAKLTDELIEFVNNF